MPQSATRFREYAIQPALAPFVKSIWSLENTGRQREIVRQRILPDACVELVFHFRDPFRNYFADGTTNLQPQSFVVGQMKNFLEIKPAGSTGFVAVRFYAKSAYLFFRQPMSEVTDSIVPLPELWATRANEYTERLALAGEMTTRVRIVEEILFEALRQNGQRDCALEHCVELVQNSPEQMPVKELGSTIGLSSRQLGRRFQKAIGMTPKEFMRVNRFIRAAHHLREHASSSFTETAHECAYFDQAHFNREFREFAGMTPGEFIATENVAI